MNISGFFHGSAMIDFDLPLDFQRVVCEGIWFFPGDEAPAPVFVVEQNYDFWYLIDRRAPALNADGLVYYILFNPPVERPWWVDSPGFGSAREAMEWAEGIVTGPIAWGSWRGA